MTNVKPLHSRSFFCKPVTVFEIENKISLPSPNNKTYGLYSCPIRALKCAKSIVSLPLAEIINMSILTGIYSSKLKLSKVIPIFKCYDETDPSNYRLISLLSIFNQNFEKLMYNCLKSFIEENELLYEAQYGFREKSSTKHSLHALQIPSRRFWIRKCFHVES